MSVTDEEILEAAAEVARLTVAGHVYDPEASRRLRARPIRALIEREVKRARLEGAVSALREIHEYPEEADGFDLVVRSLRSYRAALDEEGR